MDTHRSVGLALGYAAFLVVPIGLWMRSFATSTGRAVFDITMRDLTIRANGVLGLLTLAFLTVGGLLLPIGLLAGMLNIFLPIEVGTKILSGLLVSILLLPISAALVLILRALPWIQAFPYILESIIQSLRMWFVETVPVNRDTNSESDSEAEFMPFEGHSHTHVSVDTKTKVSMPGFYGYLPQQVQDLQLTNGTVSVRKGLWLAPPGMIWFTTIFAWRELYPESAAHWLGIFPAESILITSLSYVGIPRLIVTELLGLLGLPESTLSLGFVGGIIPVLLLIPTAWHFVLAYEGWLYHVLAKLGCNNRILFLWIIHLLPLAPLVALTFHLRDRIQQRRTTASAD